MTDDYLSAMEALWYSDRPAHHGRFANFEGIDAHPRPVQSPIPVVVGGRSPSAFRRAVSRGAGWYGFFLSPEEAAAAAAGLRRAADEVERPPGLGPLELSVTPRGRLSHETVTAFADAGVSRLVVMPSPAATAEDVMAMIESTAAVVADA